MYVSELGEQWRRARLRPEVVHLDSAAAGRSSNAVIGSISAHLWRESERGSYVAAADRADEIARDKRDLASLIGHTADELAFRESARAALRALLTYWNLPISSTVWVAKNEFGPNLVEFERRGYAVRPLPDADIAGHVDTDALENMLQFEQPDFIHICHIGAMSGIVQPVTRIVEIAHAAGVPVVVDMAQTAGHVPTVTGADVVYGTSRKWLTGPRGVGFVAVRKDALRPVEIESSEAFVAGRLGLGMAVSEVLAIGQQRVFRELAAIGRATRERLDGIGSWEVLEPVDEPCSTTTLAPPPGWQPSDVAAAQAKLFSLGILVTCADSWRAPLTTEQSVLRISPHLDVEREDLDKLADALRTMGY
ncbi:aminotransferase class V-fold PLP-dependent enzyme [Gordonia sp. HNM0687]|uniref:Aminotransferase class V-fold PLP-dependent enzyme n=1 Tax=Gordonia mangrovi TaxID=2665643 RepID=A0A6L7GS77_9ACTN|nr:aminotransferase class V-fold PLP-dependent enzyme [Gordonia mangrovi]MDY6807879.1 aminotransferase class V-fold PLP-dependent enzyme [Actinomycetota bacterium]MXP21408.1 aminotransferase class V-fold PLP-dependent enzyme [Gordonia mangrovi]UVF80157.1 aminotransferase class V-fold PLP-dependent enzyme [Gordonia mangrovi]